MLYYDLIRETIDSSEKLGELEYYGFSYCSVIHGYYISNYKFILFQDIYMLYLMNFEYFQA